MKSIFIIASTLLIVACGSNVSEKKRDTSSKFTSTTKDAKNEVVKKEEPILPNKSVDTLNTKQLKQLSKYFKKSSVLAYQQLISDFRFAKTDTMLEKAYMNAQKVLGILEEEIQGKNADAYEIMENLSFLDHTFGIRATCAAECTAFLFEIDHKDFKKLAKETKGDADDQFFALKESVQGEKGGFSPGWLVFFERTWDYGGGVTLGDNQMFTFLKNSHAFLQKSELFKLEINELREETIQNLSHPIYMNSKEKVQKEINKILKANCLTAKEKKLVRETLIRNEKTDLDPPVQFNCITENCDWGG